MDFVNELKYKYKSGSLLTKLIFINVGVFVVLTLTTLIMKLFGLNAGVVTSLVELPSTWTGVLHRPWTVITYMFMHADMFHIFFNMLCLYWMGMVFMEYNTPKQLVALYIMSGIGGALLYLLAYNYLPYFAGSHGVLVGASASVIGVMVAAAMRAPEYRLNLLFFGAVAMKWLVIVMLLIDVLSIDGGNPGGHIAHLGGAVVGAVYALMQKRGHDITGGVNRLIDQLVGAFRKKGGVKEPVGGTKYHYNENTETKKTTSSRSEFVTEEEEAIDVILEKIKQSGYASLTKEEKARLFNAGKK